MHIVQPIGTISGSAISRIAVTLAEEFARAGHDSTLVIWNRTKLAREIDPRVKIVEVSIPGLSRRNLWTKLLRGLFKPFLGTRLFLVVFARFISNQLQRKVLEQADYDVALLHAHSVFHLRHVKTPYVVVAHNTKSRQLLDSRWRYANEALRTIYTRVYRDKPIICVSEGIRQDFIHEFNLSAHNLTTIHNPVDIKTIIEQSNQEKPDDAPLDYVIAIGRDDPQKRFDRLIKAYACANVAPDLVLLGRAAENTKLHQLAHKLGIADKVHFLGFRDNPYPYIKAARALILSSDYEGFGMVIIEALICNTPVVSTNCPSGPSEILTGPLSRHLVPQQDQQALAIAIRGVLANPSSIKKQHVSRFDKTRIGQEYLSQLTRYLESAPHE